MADVQVISDFICDTFKGVNDIQSLKAKIQEKLKRCPSSIYFKNYDIFINKEPVHKHNTPLFDGDVVIMRGKYISVD